MATTFSGTGNNDYIVPTADGVTYRGVQGNDTYILSSLITAGSTIVITDTEGNNRIQLTDGLSIASSVFLADSVQLCLSNGSKIQITGALDFIYDIGANATSGDTPSLPAISYQSFAAVLGVAELPAYGSASVAGITNYIVPAFLSLQDNAVSKSVRIGALGDMSDLDDFIVKTLYSGYHWSSDDISYTFNSIIPPEYLADKELVAGWIPFSVLQEGIVEDIFYCLEDLTGLHFTESSSNGNIRFNIVDTDDDVAGFAYYPSDSSTGGDVFISDLNSTDYTQLSGDFGYFVFLHEIGHAMGLKHSFEDGAVLSETEDNIVHTVMSYTNWKNYAPSFSWSSEGISCTDRMIAFPGTYSLYDVAALQAVYGYNQTTRTGSDTYSVSYDSHEYKVIWDAGGTDLINAGDATFLCSIDLRPGAFSSVNMHSLQVQEAATVQMYQQAGYALAESWVHGVYSDTSRTGSWYTGENNLAIGYGVIIENVTTGSGNDTIVDNQVDNIINSGAGNDAIQLTGAGFDYVDGGAGIDSVRLPVNSSAIQKGITSTGSWLVVGSSFAVELTGVEQLVYADGSSFTLTV